MLRQPAWRHGGEEPDYRFSLANERTFLAWIRTAMAVLAAGVVLDQFSVRLQPRLFIAVLASALCALAAVLCGLAYQRWKGNETAMRHKRPLPFSTSLIVLAGSILVAAVMLAMIVLLGQSAGG